MGIIDDIVLPWRGKISISLMIKRYKNQKFVFSFLKNLQYIHKRKETIESLNVNTNPNTSTKIKERKIEDRKNELNKKKNQAKEIRNMINICSYNKVEF